jgi:membrane complex biogenesis BtpA family protein
MTRGLIGVVHLPAMPGDPAHRAGSFADLLEHARRDAAALAEGGADAIIVENFGSAPFPKGTPDQPTPPHQIAAIALAIAACKAVSGLSVGVNVLRNDVRAALGIAAACEASFVRVNVHVGAYVTDQGIIEGRAFETLRYRREIGAESVAIFADVRVKHASPLAPVTVATEVEDCLHRAFADAVVVTGAGTGKPVSTALLTEVRGAAGEGVVLIGSGLAPDRAPTLAPLADGAIVGTWIKEGGDVRAPIDPRRVRALVDATAGRWRSR